MDLAYVVLRLDRKQYQIVLFQMEIPLLMLWQFLNWDCFHYSQSWQALPQIDLLQLLENYSPVKLQ